MRFLVACGLLASLCIAATAQQFDCPSDASSAACHSYKELLAARDKQVASDYVVFTCFDKFEDRFFLINAESPVFQEKINDGKAHTEQGFVGLITFVNGVEDDSALPYAFGDWEIESDI